MDNESREQVTVAGEEDTGKEKADQKEVKTFTQEEVDKIIQKRLTREREKLTKAFEEGTRESDLDERERNITRRELKADTLERLAESGMPLGLAELIDYSSKEECEKSIVTVSKVFNAAVNEAVKAKARQATPKEGYVGLKSDPLARAFKL